MTKTVPFRQPTVPPPQTVESWVKPPTKPLPATNAEAKEPMTHFTVDLPESLHTRFRMECVRRRVKAYELLPQILDKALTEMETGA